MKRDFLMVRDFTTEEIHETFEIARDMKKDRKKYSKALEGETMALIFEKPSLRTRTTFDVGIQQLGGYSLYLSPAEINLGKRESVYDVAKNLERMVQGIMIRTFGHDIVENMSKYAKIPIINGLTDYSHPCQAMADYLTILEVKGKLEGLKLTYVGDGNNVAHSLMDAGARLGVNVTISCPRGYEPNMMAYNQAVEDAKLTGAKIEVVHDPFEAVKGADAIYTDVWASMGQEAEAAERRRIFLPYQVNENLMAAAKDDAIFLHCLPAHRGDEVTDGVIDAPNSYVFPEAENRLHAQKAIMYKLLKQD
ncbi:MAG: ornithine carbamoyltransferase [Candidatus Kapabacteria bacterium]|nr:ornithine carbamoyltransferase [Ignavibacteriota bacterium]MCW5884576.1 ornithine carbamoyltransferase [Candidatus Kapabacteria bacterium]